MFVLSESALCGPGTDTENDVQAVLHQGAIVALTHALDGTKQLSVGKTQIAIEYVYRYQSNYSTVIWLQDNPHQPGSEQIRKQLAALAHGAELLSSDITRPAEIMASLKEWLAQQTQWLLVLDGIKNSQLIADLIPSSRSGHVLITTRERAIASLASLVEIAEQTEEEKALSARLDQLVNSALHGLNKEQYLLRPGTTSLGRAPENTLCFDDPSVSLYHAIITMQGGAYQITDLNSEQGTFVEGRRLIPLQAYPLSLQETIRLGHIWLAYGTDVSSLALPSSATEMLPFADEGSAMIETREHASASPHTQEVTPHIPLPLIDNPQQILAQVRDGNAPDDWKVFHSQKVSFQEFRSLMIAMDVAFMRALALVFFLTLSLLPLVSALAEDDKGITFTIFLLTVCVDGLAVAFFVMMMVEAIDQAPALRMETPQEGALLVLTPNGFVEYVDDEQVIDTVSFGAVSLMQQRIEEDDQAWLDIAYVDHRRGQWTPRAQFGPIRSLTKQIFQAFLEYTERYNQ